MSHKKKRPYGRDYRPYVPQPRLPGTRAPGPVRPRGGTRDAVGKDPIVGRDDVRRCLQLRLRQAAAADLDSFVARLFQGRQLSTVSELLAAAFTLRTP